MYTSSPSSYEHTPLHFADTPDMSTYSYEHTSSGSSSGASMQYFTGFETPDYEPQAFFTNPTQFVDPRATNLIEFTDLTTRYHDERRRVRSEPPRDDEAVSTMHMRRRAQNRASQRAFRERKEKYVADLQTQLHELESRNRKLEKSRSDLDRANERLQREVDRLRAELQSLDSEAEQSMGDLLAPEIFEQYFQRP
ncbi:Basic-leucine zipper domain [Lasallia pustulata]|nr:Basic-leucine zipper domain [Lasallia pustulata]